MIIQEYKREDSGVRWAYGKCPARTHHSVSPSYTFYTYPLWTDIHFYICSSVTLPALYSLGTLTTITIMAITLGYLLYDRQALSTGTLHGMTHSILTETLEYRNY